MIQLRNTTEFYSKKLERLMRIYNSGRYQFDVNAIQADIEKFTAEAAIEKDETIRTNKIQIARYLKFVLLPNLNRFNRIRLKWVAYDDGTVYTVPVKLLSMRWCGLNIVDYLYKTDENTVELNYKDLWDAMAFVIAHDDLGVGIGEIEAKLKNCKVLAINNSIDVKTLYDDKTYNDVNMMRIGSSEFVYPDNSAITYFGDKIENATYKDIVNASVRKMMACILAGLLGKQDREAYHVEFLGMFESSIYFNTNMDRDEILKMLHRSVVLRMFGRDFEFVPKIRIY